MLLSGYQSYEKRPEDVLAVTIGNPKTEVLGMDRSFEGNHKSFLFIDSGHYPFGLEGRKCLAKLLIDICNKFKDYSLTVKPRFLPADKGVTHANFYHLCDTIKKESGGNLPANLALLMPMNELIDKADVVLCMYTTAYFDVAAMGKRCIIIDGLPDNDCFDLNNKVHWHIAREVMKESGCLVHYKDVLKYFPEGLICSKNFMEKHLPVFNEKSASENAADIIEYCFANYISKGKFIANVSCDAANYKNSMVEATGESWGGMINRRLKNMIWFLASRSVHSDIIWEEFEKKFDLEGQSWIEHSGHNYRKLHEIVTKELHSIVAANYEN